MDTKTKNIVYTAIVVLVVILIASSMYKGAGDNPAADNTASSTDNSIAGNSNKSGQSGGSTYTFKGATNSKGSNSSISPSGPNLEDNSVLSTVISNALIHVPQTSVDVTLTAGGANYSDSNGRVTGRVQAGRIIGWVKTDNGYDVFTDMTVTRDGLPQVLHYAALFHVVSPTNVRYTSAVFIGDRLPITGIAARPDTSKQLNPSKTVMSSTLGYYLSVNYMDRKNAEPVTVTPSLAESAEFTIKNHYVSK